MVSGGGSKRNTSWLAGGILGAAPLERLFKITAVYKSWCLQLDDGNEAHRKLILLHSYMLSPSVSSLTLDK